MRTVNSTLVAVCGGAFILSGCGGDEATKQSSVPVDVSAVVQDDFSTPAPQEETVPTIFGVDVELQREMRSLIAKFIEQQNVPGDPADHLAKAFDSAMLRLGRPAEEFGIEADASGNIEWPEKMKEEMVKPLRAEFDSKKLFDLHKVDLPAWARPLLEEYNADELTPTRKELLFRIAIADIIKDMA